MRCNHKSHKHIGQLLNSMYTLFAVILAKEYRKLVLVLSGLVKWLRMK